jgi:hypothetical protein
MAEPGWGTMEMAGSSFEKILQCYHLSGPSQDVIEGLALEDCREGWAVKRVHSRCPQPLSVGEGSLGT